MDPLGRLALASFAFFALHAFISATRLRDALIRALGEGPFRGLFSLATLGSLVWLSTAYRSSPCAPLWVLPRAFGWLPLAVMPFALFLVVGAFSVPNPTAVGGERTLNSSEPARGALRITRHPFLWGVMLWSSVHALVLGSTAGLLFFGSFFVTAALGTRSIDRKRARADAAAWQRYLALTSNVPLLAVVGGRNRLRPRELTTPALIAAVLLVALLAGHRFLFGVSALPL
jgi:uncharacterized membrane protein